MHILLHTATCLIKCRIKKQYIHVISNATFYKLMLNKTVKVSKWINLHSLILCYFICLSRKKNKLKHNISNKSLIYSLLLKLTQTHRFYFYWLNFENIITHCRCYSAKGYYNSKQMFRQFNLKHTWNEALVISCINLTLNIFKIISWGKDNFWFKEQKLG
jgi:hypothetical protein